MSREGRAAHARNKRRHDQRQFGEVKPKSISQDVSTAWVGPFVESLQGLATWINADSILALPLGATKREREFRLRQLSQMGILRMYVHKDHEFVEYRWVVTEAASL